MTPEEKFDKLKKLTKEDLFNKTTYPYNLTLKRFREITKDMPEDSVILVERIHDTYFENHNWSVYLEENEYSFQERESQNSIETLSGESIPQNPKDPKKIEMLKSEYIPAHFCIKRKSEPKIIYIDFHY